LRETTKPINNKVDNLLPWDAHLAYFDIDIDSTLIGKPLVDLSLREKYGINLALIERGDRMIMIPDKYEKLFPFDRIAVIGTDEQILTFKNTIEAANKAQIFDDTKGEITLTQIHVHPGFPFLGQTIRESELRDKVKGLIVGIERNGQRILNPDSNLTFELNDALWIAGDRKKVKQLLT
jgi:CPA2 family monovalent cation:H+ antiporter-2